MERINFSTRLTPDVHKALSNSAGQNKRSMQKQMHEYLESCLKRDGFYNPENEKSSIPAKN